MYRGITGDKLQKLLSNNCNIREQTFLLIRFELWVITAVLQLAGQASCYLDSFIILCDLHKISACLLYVHRHKFNLVHRPKLEYIN